MPAASLKRKLMTIRAFCAEHADPAIVRKYAKYFTEGYDAYGVDGKTLETQRGIWLEAWREELGLDGVLDLGDLLVKTGKYEEGSCAIWFAAAFKEKHTPRTFTRLGRWLDDGGLRNWGHVDAFCSLVLSDLVAEKVVALQAMASWRTSPSKWKRRAVPVALLRPLKAGFAVKPLLEFIAPMMLDPEKPVQQGLGWFLREAWKLQPGPVERFLLRWKESCGRVIIQYATEKMTAEQKARFKRSAR